MALPRRLFVATIILSRMWWSALMACLPSQDRGILPCVSGTCKRKKRLLFLWSLSMKLYPLTELYIDCHVT